MPETLLPLNNATVMQQAQIVRADPLYSRTEPMLENLLKQFPGNTLPEQVAAKVLLVDKLYSTRIFDFKKMSFLPEMVDKIISIPDFDLRVSNGDAAVVCEIYKDFPRKMFSFATKYCCLHNTIVYKRDDYSIYDSAVHRLLPKYAKNCGVNINGAQISRWYQRDDYNAFNNAVNAVLDAAGITVQNRRRAFDLFLWSQR